MSKHGREHQNVDALKPREQLLFEIDQLREEVEACRQKEMKHQSDQEELRETLHSLSVHQEELKTQNEELMALHRELEDSHRKYMELYDFAPIGYFTLDRNGIVLDVNLTGAEMLERDKNSLLRKPLVTGIDPKSRELFLASLRLVFDGGESTIEVGFKRGKESHFPAEMKCVPVFGEGKQVRQCWAVMRDITERVRAENKIKASLDEKEVLLRELHHRVKNNMAVITGLLRLQSRTIRDEALKNVFRESQSRISSMALIHETLYQSELLSEINLQEYIGQLSKSLLGVYGISAHQVKVSIMVHGINLNIDQAVPCGLVLNELISNALKYSLEGGRSGKIVIESSLLGEDDIQLVVRDSGPGIPETFDLDQSDTLGLRLVKNLVERQLNGTFNLNRRHGAEFLITFRRKDAEMRNH